VLDFAQNIFDLGMNTPISVKTIDCDSHQLFIVFTLNETHLAFKNISKTPILEKRSHAGTSARDDLLDNFFLSLAVKQLFMSFAIAEKSFFFV
jgi:hypothetical protein